MATLDTHRTKTAQINDKLITILPKETVLTAALRQGIDFPNSCRVGGCATCKCKLVEGEVKELTESGYLLSAEEIDQGTILACQSVPKTDVRIEVDLSRNAGKRKVRGRVVAQERVTHDITHLLVQLDERLDYRAGQFANLSRSATSSPDRARSYFAERMLCNIRG